MEEIKRQVNRAQRRLIGQQFLQIVVWSLFVTLLIAAIGLAIPKIWALQLNHDVWNYSWLASSLAVGFVIAAVWTYRDRRTSIEAAIELDRRYGLKERVSSTLALNQDEAATDIGRALVADAIRKVERIDVREQFRIQPTWRVALPIIPLAVITALLFVPNASLVKNAAAKTQSPADLKQALKGQADRLAELARKRSEKKPEDEVLPTDKDLKEVAKQLDDFSKEKNLDKKQVNLKLTDLAKQFQEKQKALAGNQEMKKDLIKLDKVEKGPADKMVDALKNGDFKDAQKQLERLKGDLAAGKLDDQAKEQLAKQMNDLKEQLQQLAADQKEARQRVEQERDKKLAQGDPAGAQKLQEQLDQMNKQGKQAAEQKLYDLAQQMEQAANALKQGGDPKEAGEKLEQLAKAMKEAQDQLDEIQKLDEVLDQLAEAKDALNGKEGKEGKSGMDGKLAGNKKSKNQANQNGRGGKGPGTGERPEEPVKTEDYTSQVRGQVQPGGSVRTGVAGGENAKVEYQKAVKAELESAGAKDPDAIEQVNLPREQQRQVEDYFNRFRQGRTK